TRAPSPAALWPTRYGEAGRTCPRRAGRWRCRCRPAAPARAEDRPTGGTARPASVARAAHRPPVRGRASGRRTRPSPGIPPLSACEAAPFLARLGLGACVELQLQCRQFALELAVTRPALLVEAAVAERLLDRTARLGVV